MHRPPALRELEPPLWSWRFFLCRFPAGRKRLGGPTPQPAKTYAAHDEHPSELVTVALDPYGTEDKAKIFTVHFYHRDGPSADLRDYLTNAGDQPVALSEMKAQLVTGDRTKLDPDSEDDTLAASPIPTPAPPTVIRCPFPARKSKGRWMKRPWRRFKARNSAPKPSNLTAPKLGSYFSTI